MPKQYNSPEDAQKAIQDEALNSKKTLDEYIEDLNTSDRIKIFQASSLWHYSDLNEKIHAKLVELNNEPDAPIDYLDPKNLTYEISDLSNNPDDKDNPKTDPDLIKATTIVGLFTIYVDDLYPSDIEEAKAAIDKLEFFKAKFNPLLGKPIQDTYKDDPNLNQKHLSWYPHFHKAMVSVVNEYNQETIANLTNEPEGSLKRFLYEYRNTPIFAQMAFANPELQAYLQEKDPSQQLHHLDEFLPTFEIPEPV